MTLATAKSLEGEVRHTSKRISSSPEKTHSTSGEKSSFGVLPLKS